MTTFCADHMARVQCLSWMRSFYFDEGLLPEPGYADHRVALFQRVESDAVVVVVFVALVVSSILVMAGWWVRLSAPVLWLTMMTMQLGAPSTLNAGDMMLRIWTAYLALFACARRAGSCRCRCRGEPAPDGGHADRAHGAGVVRAPRPDPADGGVSRHRYRQARRLTPGARAQRRSNDWVLVDFERSRVPDACART